MSDFRERFSVVLVDVPFFSQLSLMDNTLFIVETLNPCVDGCMLVAKGTEKHILKIVRNPSIFIAFE